MGPSSKQTSARIPSPDGAGAGDRPQGARTSESARRRRGRPGGGARPARVPRGRVTSAGARASPPDLVPPDPGARAGSANTPPGINQPTPPPHRRLPLEASGGAQGLWAGATPRPAPRERPRLEPSVAGMLLFFYWRKSEFAGG